MSQLEEGGQSIWLGNDATGAGPGVSLGEGLWVGQHAGDGDILVYDPEESDASSEVIGFYSLSKHRHRRFPRTLIGDTIVEVTDESESARALEDYERRGKLRAKQQDQQEADRSQQAEELREAVISAHKVFLEGLGIEYQGVERTDGNRKSGRRTKCPNCGIALDDFAHAVCGVCNGVLCSCGACVCGVN